MIIVFDTNIWKSSLYLQSPAAAAVRLFLKRRGAKVGLPEVVRLEVERHLRNDLNILIKSSRENHERLLRMFGSLRELVLPADDEVEARVNCLFEVLGVELQEIPFSLESARDSFLRTVDKRPPSDRSQQFKDGVLWADCVALLETDELCLVTSDRAFYEDHSLEKGIAPLLAAEAANAPHELTLLPRIGDLLKDISVDLQLDADAISEAVMQEAGDSANDLVTRNGFNLGERIELLQDLFATENASKVFLEFVIRYQCLDETASGRAPAVLTIEGDAIYHTGTEIISDLRRHKEALEFIADDGSEQEKKNVFMHIEGAVIGHRKVSNTIRYKLDD